MFLNSIFYPSFAEEDSKWASKMEKRWRQKIKTNKENRQKSKEAAKLLQAKWSRIAAAGEAEKVKERHQMLLRAEKNAKAEKARLCKINSEKSDWPSLPAELHSVLFMALSSLLVVVLSLCVAKKP